MSDKKRIYGDKFEISIENVKAFYEKRAHRYGNDLTVVNLQKDQELMNKRNENEKELFLPLFNFSGDERVFEAGCGLGRFAELVKDDIYLYLGIDFSDEIILLAKEHFKGDHRVNFQKMSASSIRLSDLIVKPPFDVILAMGLMVYLNDEDVCNLLNKYMCLANGNCKILLKESISVMNERLTLNQVESEVLDDDYSAVYRTTEEYELIFRDTLLSNGFELIETHLVLKNDLVNRVETNQRFWFFKRVL